ncbi:MAG: 4Fe-4S dicluster domain-containing protein [Desulfovibrio sp.]|uniref:4Fe-4S dicluster domain-containing protein n=1 Tax=Desulfovibrio sp. 7SRBS1 TaxID=3378064 RepID=UPI003B41CF18
MNKIDFSLKHQTDKPLTEIAPGSELVLWVNNYTPEIGRGKKVVRGTRLATHQEEHGGSLCSPCTGKITSVDVGYIRIKVTPPQEGEEAETVEKIDLLTESTLPEGEELRTILANLGIDTRPVRKADVLLVNGLNPEPGIMVYGQLYNDCREIVEAGLRIARRVVQPSSCFFAADESSKTFADCKTIAVKPVYPQGLAPLLADKAMGKNFKGSVAVLGLKELYFIGRVAQTGLPLDHTVITVNNANYYVPLGMPVHEVLETAGLEYGKGDRVVLGGPMRGWPIYNLEHGVGRRHCGIFVVKRDQFPPVVDTPCINCGECVLHCPARLRPNEITRYAEYDMFEKAEKAGLYSCLDCGLCAYHCTVNRPLKHYLRFAKRQLLERAQNASAE